MKLNSLLFALLTIFSCSLCLSYDLEEVENKFVDYLTDPTITPGEMVKFVMAYPDQVEGAMTRLSGVVADLNFTTNFENMEDSEKELALRVLAFENALLSSVFKHNKRVSKKRRWFAFILGSVGLGLGFSRGLKTTDIRHWLTNPVANVLSHTIRGGVTGGLGGYGLSLIETAPKVDPEDLDLLPHDQ